MDRDQLISNKFFLRKRDELLWSVLTTVRILLVANLTRETETRKEEWNKEILWRMRNEITHNVEIKKSIVTDTSWHEILASHKISPKKCREKKML